MGEHCQCCQATLSSCCQAMPDVMQHDGRHAWKEERHLWQQHYGLAIWLAVVSNLTICEATRGSYCIARAIFVSGPRASMEISPGWASTISAINLAAGVAIATPCLTPFQCEHSWQDDCLKYMPDCGIGAEVTWHSKSP